MANLNAQKVAALAQSNTAVLNGKLQDAIIQAHESIMALGPDNTLTAAMRKSFEELSNAYNDQFVPVMKQINEIMMEKAEYFAEVERNTSSMSTKIEVGDAGVSGALSGL